MSIFEYDEEKHMKSEREEAYKTGREDGERDGEQRRARQDALRMLEDGELPLKKIARYSGLSQEAVQELKEELQPV